MERHPRTAVIISCGECGFMRIADDYASAEARATAHSAVTNHTRVKWKLTEAPDRIKVRPGG